MAYAALNLTGEGKGHTTCDCHAVCIMYATVGMLVHFLVAMADASCQHTS